MSKIKFITDSAADIPAELAKELGIQVIPFPIHMEGRDLLDGVDMTRQEFYAAIEKASEIPVHAQLTPFQLEEVFTQAYTEGYTDIIYTSINFKGSATGNNAILARESLYEAHPKAREAMQIHILDSKSYTFAYGYAVVEGAKKAAAGAAVDEVLDFMRDWLDHMKILFATYDLRFARKSGRVSAAAAIVGGALGICPIMSFPNGESKVCAKVRGAKAVVPQMCKMLAAEADPDAPYLVINAALPDRNQEILERAKAVMGRDPAYVFEIGGVITINAGPQVVGVVFREK